MLYVIFGSDTRSARDKIYHLIRSLRQKKALSDYVHIDVDSEKDPFEYVGRGGLFGQKTIIFLDDIRDTHKKRVQKNIKQFIQSPNVFFLFEEKLLKNFLDTVVNFGGIVESYMAPKQMPARTAVFTLADSFLQKAPQRSFKIFHQLLKDGLSVEEIFGVITWQLRVLLLAYRTETAKDAGVSPYPYTKAKKYLSSFDQQVVLDAFDLINQSFGTIQMSREKKILRAEHTLLEALSLLCAEKIEKPVG